MIAAFIIIAFLAVLVAALIYAHKADKKRTAEFAAAAEEMGLTFHDRQVEALRFQIGDFRLFNTGRNRKFKNIMVAETAEARIGIFDYQYTTGGGKNSSTHYQTVAVIEASELTIPEFSMRPEVSLFDAIGNMIGFSDIDFPEHPGFSSAFVLKSPDELATRELLTTDLLDFFASHPKISLEARPGAVIYFRTRRRIKPAELRDFFEQAFSVFKALTDRLVQDRR